MPLLIHSLVYPDGRVPEGGREEREREREREREDGREGGDV